MSTIEEVRKETEKSREEKRIARENHQTKCAAPFVEIVRSRFMPAAKNGDDRVSVPDDIFVKEVVGDNHVYVSNDIFVKEVVGRGFGLPTKRYESLLLPGCDADDTRDGLAQIFRKEGYYAVPGGYSLTVSWAKK